MSEELRALQAPIKARYKETPQSALITLKAEGRLGEGVTCSVQTSKALVSRPASTRRAAETA